MLRKYLSIAVRLIFALWYFGVGIIGFITNDAVKDAAKAAPLVIIIFCFHMVITKSYLWGSLNLILLAAIAWQFRRGFDQLWNYAGPAH